MSSGTKRWRCVICGYEHEGPEPPAVCPLCAAGPEDFELIGEPAGAAPSPGGGGLGIVIVGGGIAGAQAAASARKTSEGASITLLDEELDLPYQRINLTRYVSGGMAREKLPLHPPAWYEEQRIRLETGATVASASIDGKTVTLAGGETIPFDRLIVATGARAFLPPVAGLDLEGVSALRTKHEADRIVERGRRGDRCVVVGGGILGLEVAAGLAAQGVPMTVLEGYDWLMPRQMDERSGRRLESHLARRGIDLRRNARLEEIVGDGKATGVRLADGSVIEADMVVLATGIRPEIGLAGALGLDVNRGVLVDDRMATSRPDVYAAGDVTEHEGRQYGLWGPAQRQGAVAGTNAAGGEDRFVALPKATSLKVLDLVVFSTGALAVEQQGDVALWGEVEDRSYHLVVRDGKLAGAVVIGDMKAASRLRKAVEASRDVSTLLTDPPDPIALVETLKDE